MSRSSSKYFLVCALLIVSVFANLPVPENLLASNVQWAEMISAANPDFFQNSSMSQSPEILWIGCSDSRVPASVVTNSTPGVIFTHRNIANQFHLDDDNAQAVMEYALNGLNIQHVVVVGHSSCGGVIEAFNSAASPSDHRETETPLERWLEPLTDYARSINVTANSLSEDQGVPLLVEDNVKLQVNNLLMSEFVLEKGANVWVHGWVYDLANGTLRDLGISRNGSKISW